MTRKGFVGTQECLAIRVRKGKICFGLLRFSTRKLLAVFVLCSIVLALYSKDVFRSRVESRVAEAIEASGGVAVYDYQTRNGYPHSEPVRPPTGTRFERWLFGENIYSSVTHAIWFEHDPTDADVEDLWRLKELGAVSIRGRSMTDKCVGDLINVRKLESLSLQDVSISPQGFKELTRGNLQSLSILGDFCSDDHIEQISRLSDLKQLHLCRTVVSDDGLKPIGTMKSLLELEIWQCPDLSEDLTSVISNLEALQSLQIGQDMSDDALVPLANLTRLKKLCLRGPISDRGFCHLRNLVNLRFLELDNTLVSDESLQIISKFENLEWLKINGTCVTDEGLRHLKKLSNLKNLEINRTAVSVKGLGHLRGMKSLRSLDVEVDHYLTFDDVKDLKKHLPGCRIGCWQLGGTAMFTAL